MQMVDYAMARAAITEPRKAKESARVLFSAFLEEHKELDDEVSARSFKLVHYSALVPYMCPSP